MKSISKKLLQFQIDELLSPVRTKLDLVKVIMTSIRYLLIDDEESKNENKGELKLVINKMSRLFINSEKKIVSIAFPFHFELKGNKLDGIYSFDNNKIDSYFVSRVVRILNDTNSESLINLFTDPPDDEDILYISFLKELAQFEPGYIRFDWDTKNKNEKIHPLFHLDINFSSLATYKIGLNKKISYGELEDILNLTTNCWYLKK